MIWLAVFPTLLGPAADLGLSETVVGGGFPLISRTQGQENITIVGTLVTDGHTVLALASRHLAGPSGHPVATILGGYQVDIGHSTDQQLPRDSGRK